MATTNGTLEIYDSFKRYKSNKTIDLENDTFICGLSTSAYTFDKNAHETLSDITNELSGNGYARQTLTGVAFTEPTNGTWRFTSNDVVFAASGGALLARTWWIFDDTPTSPVDPLCFAGLLDDTPADVSTADGSSLTIRVNANGYYQEAGG